MLFRSPRWSVGTRHPSGRAILRRGAVCRRDGKPTTVVRGGACRGTRSWPGAWWLDAGRGLCGPLFVRTGDFGGDGICSSRSCVLRGSITHLRKLGSELCEFGGAVGVGFGAELRDFRGQARFRFRANTFQLGLECGLGGRTC